MNEPGYPSLAITFFLHEAYGEERILKVLDYFQHPPWQFHHTESCGGIPTAPPSRSPSAALLQPYLLPSRDFFSLGAGMPVWGVRPVHCGGEILRVTLYSTYDNYEDAVRFYETVLRQRAEEQKAGFCWFTLHSGTRAPLGQLCVRLASACFHPFPLRCRRARPVHAARRETAAPGAQGESVPLGRAAVPRGRHGPAGSAAAQPLQPHQQHALADGRPGRQQGPLPGESGGLSSSHSQHPLLLKFLNKEHEKKK